MKKFSIDNIKNIEDNPFDRQERISWWSQEKLQNAKVMVVGAGAIGNETLKNLALLGIGNIFIVDFDTVSTSNLSRTVLFRRKDKGKNKAEIAATRTRELCLAENANVDWFHGDIVWELGSAIYQEMDIVLGCLDNVETRFAVNRFCWLTNTPWVDAGIRELGSSVTTFVPPEPPCYECGATDEQIKAIRQRYSCDDFKKSMVNEGKTPTVQIASAFVSAIQVQEAIKIICNQKSNVGQKIYFQGKDNYFDIFPLSVNLECSSHVVYPKITSLPLTSLITLKEFLEYISQNNYSGEGATLDFRSDRTFVVSSDCRFCGTSIDFYKPSFRIYDTETVCDDCQKKGASSSKVESSSTNKVTLSDFNLSRTEDRVLDMTLREIGIPPMHIVAVKNSLDNYKYYEFSHDKSLLLSSIN